MRVVILLGGSGARFADVGYTKPKPFIMVDGKTMLEHVVSMYPGSHEFIFVCNEDFVGNSVLTLLQEKLPQSRFVFIASHKQGPVHSLSFVWDELPGDEPVMVSYCDFNVHWDFERFEREVVAGQWDAAIPSYTGFHPHLLHRNKYAGIVVDASGRVEKIKEKHCFTENPEDSFHSAGNYFFARAGDLRRYGKEVIQSEDDINGEHYMSMIYYRYLNKGKSVLAYPLKHFLQWGTPEDLEEYEAWSLLINGAHKGSTDVPKSRRGHIRIPYEKGSPEYEKSDAYWRDYFSKCGVWQM